MTTDLDRRKTRRRNWIGFSLSIPALGAWIWILAEAVKEFGWAALAFAPATLVIGVAAWSLHRFAWKWRGAVSVTALVLHFAGLATLILVMAPAEASVVEAVVDMVAFSWDSVRWNITHLDPAMPSRLVIPLFLFASLVFGVLHPLYPTFSTAIASAIGFSLYFLVTALMMSQAG